MKLGSTISEEEYEERLNRLVAEFEQRMEHYRSPQGWAGRVYRAVASAREPIGYKEVSKKLVGDMVSDEKLLVFHWRISSRLNYLVETGWLTRAGLGSRGKKLSRFTLYQANPEFISHNARARIAIFDKSVARLNAKRVRTSCMAAVVRPLAPDISERDRAIVEQRIAGKSLADIGAAFGVTRERIRQIIERNMYPRDSKLKTIKREIAMGKTLCKEIRQVRGGFVAEIGGEEAIFTGFDAMIDELRRIAFPEKVDLTENHRED